VLPGIFDWLTGLPTGPLYATLAIVAAIENIFPPFPADTVVAFGSFLAARGQGTLPGVFLSTLAGNLVGALIMFVVGRRFGAGPLEKLLGGPDAELRFRDMYERHGALALFVSRFLPGIRAIVPPAAGAIRVHIGRAMLLMGTASAIWYGTIAYLGFRIGDDWERVSAAVRSSTQLMGLIAVVVTAIALAAFWWRRKRAQERT